MKEKKANKYAVTIYWSPEDEAFVAEVPELRGCATHGNTMEEAARNCEDAIGTWIEAAKRSGIEVPEPVALREFSGKFMTRISPELHRGLSLRAEIQGKSLNAYVKEVFERALSGISNSALGEFREVILGGPERAEVGDLIAKVKNKFQVVKVAASKKRSAAKRIGSR